jgi:putative Holliday junction resolvase
MDGSEGSRAELTRKFASWLEAVTGKPIVLWDERLTTKEALKRLDRFKGDFRQKKEREDEQAAVIILETYLEKKRYEADDAEKNS